MVHALVKKTWLPAAWPLKSAAFSLRDLAANFSACGNNREAGTYNEYCRYLNSRSEDGPVALPVDVFSPLHKDLHDQMETGLAQLKPTPKAMGLARAKVAMIDMLL